MRFISVLLFVLVGCVTQQEPMSALKYGEDSITGDSYEISLQAFEQNIYPLARAHCAGCHSGGGLVEFASSDVQTGHDALLGEQKVSLANPSQSRIVQKLNEGHNCWTANCANDSSQMLDAVNAWANTVNAASANNPTDPSTCTPQVVMINDSVSSFENTVYPLTTQYCAGCHVAQFPAISNTNVQLAHDAIVFNMSNGAPVADFNNIQNSRLVRRLSQDNHNCWSGNCQNDAQEMANMIQEWKRLNDETITIPCPTN